jgi:hypothetical protein
MSPLVGLPALPAAVCSSAAGALGGTGLGAACSVAHGVSGSIGSAAGSVVGFGVGSVLDAVSSWVTSGAVWLLGQIGGVLSATTAVDLGAPWFAAHYATMVALAGVVILPLLLLGVVQALYRQSAAMLMRSVLVHVPLAVLLTAVAVTLVQTGLAVTDSLCATVSQGAGLDTGHFMATVTTALAPVQGSAEPGSAPTFVLFLGGIAVVVGAVMVWLELLLRSAAVYVAVLFLPLALAGLAWPAIAHWSRRLVDTLAALVLSKLVIVAVLSLAAGALASGTGSTPTGAARSGGGFASVLAGAALLLLAAFAPWSLFRLLPFIEAGAVGHLEGLAQRARHQASAPVKGLANVALRSAMAGSMAGSMAAGALGVIGSVGGRGGGQGGGPHGEQGGGSGIGGSAGPSPSGSGGGGSEGLSGGWDDDVDPYKPTDWAGPKPWEPGGSIKMVPPHPRSDEFMRRFAEVAAHSGGSDDGMAPSGAVRGAGQSGSAPAPAPGPLPGDDLSWVRPGVTYVGPLPRATGAREADHLGRDRTGPVLIAGSRLRDRTGRTDG